MRWGLRATIFVRMGGVVLSLLLATLVVVGLQTGQAARQRLVADLQRTRTQFEALQDFRYQSLLALSRVLSREYALRNAVATYDPPTVLSAIRSFQSRIQSDFLLITDDQGMILAATDEGVHAARDVAGHPPIQHALRGEETLAIWHRDGGLYQVATVPLLIGPDLLGTLSIGYEVDHVLLHELQAMTGSAITVMLGHTVLASTWPQDVHPALLAALTSLEETPAGAHRAGSTSTIRALRFGGATHLTLTMPLADARSRPIGVYLLQRSLDQELVWLHQMQRTLLLFGLGAVVVALGLSFLLARRITAPVQALVQGAAAVARGDYQYRVVVRARNELGVLARAYNAMAEQLAAHIAALQAAYREVQQQARALEASLQKVALLEQMKTHLGKFVPASVQRLIEQAPAAPALAKRDRDVSVLFLDLAGYTRLSQHTSHETMNALIESYFSSFLDAIYEHHGDINETAGDGLMILFQDADPVQHATSAVRAALAMQQQVAALNQTAQHPEPVLVNMGINSGLAAVGATRFAGLAGERWTYTASGPVTNIAARLAALATAGAIYLGEETAVRVNTLFELECLGKHQVKNVQEPLLVYQVRRAVPGDPEE